MNSMKYRLLIFISTTAILMILEFFYSYRKRILNRKTRWPVNLMMILLDSVFIKLILPTGLLGIAIWANSNNIGVFNYFKINSIYSGILTFIIFDLAIYFQHVYSHKWNLLWRFHQVHHTDPDLDLTTALRFHPIEMLYSLIYKACLILILGANATSLLVFEIVLNSMSMFNHANLYIPEKIEKVLRIVLVTPQMHIIHHSVLQKESDTNFGFNFSLWDYLLGTYTSKFKSSGKIGQEKFFGSEKQKLIFLLKWPFISHNKFQE